MSVRFADLAAAALHVLEPEAAHTLAHRALGWGLGPAAPAPEPILSTELAGLWLASPVGLAAGFDKDAQSFAPLLRLGFGFVECGTTTPRPQPGNPKPRVFRLRQDHALVNRLGFNNGGLEGFALRLAARSREGARGGVVGANVGANKDSADRAADYVAGLIATYPNADYVTANVSSPNTPGLRDLQSRGALADLLGRLIEAREGLIPAHGRKPLFLKVAPDLHEGDARDIAEVALEAGIDALIVSNTTIARPSSLASPHRSQAGGLSGRPLFEQSTRMLRMFAQMLSGRIPLIGVGGVESGATALAKIKAGAAAVQIYTALIYGGPGLPARLNADLAQRLKVEGFANVSDAVGVDVR